MNVSTISAEQRDKEIASRRAMLEAAEQLSTDEQTELASHLSTRDRLMRRLAKRKVTTIFRDDLGDFKVDTRLMNGSERARFLSANKQLSESQTDPDKYNSSIKAIKEIVSELCLTPDIPKEFWVSDEVEDSIILTVALNTLNGVADSVMEGVKSFRPQ